MAITSAALALNKRARSPGRIPESASKTYPQAAPITVMLATRVRVGMAPCGDCLEIATAMDGTTKIVGAQTNIRDYAVAVVRSLGGRLASAPGNKRCAGTKQPAGCSAR